VACASYRDVFGGTGVAPVIEGITGETPVPRDGRQLQE